MIAPTRRCAILFGAGALVALTAPLIAPRLWIAWAAYNFAAIVLTGADAIMSPRRSSIRSDVSAPAAVQIGESSSFSVELTQADSRIAVPVEVTCDLAGEVHPIRSQSTSFSGSAGLVFPFTPTRRGVVAIQRLWARWTGPLGLVASSARFERSDEIAVIPNVRAVRGAGLRWMSNRQFLAGMKAQKYVGDGTEFDALREYLPGFDHRAIDWKVSARHRRLMVREYRAERNHRVIVALDTGHLMAENVDGIPRLDHAANAALLLSYVSLKMGDRVGLAAFDEGIHTYRTPTSGVQTVHQLTDELSRLRYSSAETNFTLSLLQLSQRMKRRSIVIVLTDFTDSVTAELMVEHLTRVARRHLVIFVAIRDSALARLADARPNSLMALNQSVVSSSMADERQVVISRLRRAGIQCVDADPAAINVDLINSYMNVKRRGMV